MKQKDSLKRKMNSDLKICTCIMCYVDLKKNMNFTESFIKKKSITFSFIVLLYFRFQSRKLQ